MFDPESVAFEIKYPWRKYKKWPKGIESFDEIPKNKKHKYSQWWRNGYRDDFIIIWHKDPCLDGSDDSCDWFGRKRKLNQKEKNVSEKINSLSYIICNPPFYPDHNLYLLYEELLKAKNTWLTRSKYRVHPRWHVHHWRITIRPLQKLIRFLFKKCSVCGRGFRWDEEVFGNWGGTKSWHAGCDGNLL